MCKTIPDITLNDGFKIPAIGFGTYTLKGKNGIKSIQDAVNAGYRLLDSAFNYENEGTVGHAIKKCFIGRDKLFVCSKLPGRRQAYREALETIEESLYRADLDYYDLYLIHWPNPRIDQYVEAWQAFIEARKRGYIRSIGVCNFLPEHIDRLLKETDVCPCINQIELHPYFNQELQRNYNSSHHIVTQSWSPLGRGNALLTDPVIANIANTHQKSVSQIILRWHVQLNALPIPKASGITHQRENIDIFNFQLSDEEMLQISGLTRTDGRSFAQDPAVYEEF
ncbi:aldo/keto reductase [Pectinatus haikarae]|uniref:Diketogulonate reductase-like aldo/keto reductase n=1 Tax=Pectinatus haikarae TaxID=349096 RepID=A0ABT9YCQ9_9FIRM|nr:aldo/keto reductase [Pectinatus haikarae]MDQ0204854.1 diketogulonate reductase-like aldo/keto reductase [Pectinatus haikarae]